MSTQNTITCPNCKHEFAIEAALKNNLEKEVSEKMRAEFNQKASEWQKEQTLKLSQKEAEIEAKLKTQQTENEAILQKKSAEMLEQIKQKIQLENAEMILALKKDNEEQTQKISTLKKLEVEFMEKEKALREEKENMELVMKKQLLESTMVLEEKIKKEETSKNELKFKEYEKQLEDQKKLVEEMRRKAEQGSMQLQGEVQELAIEEWIESKFPYDQLEEIKKGARGGDCVQVVYDRNGQNCGKIYYESKRTKDFQPTWIEKFKVDMREIGADIGVIVTQTMPKDMPRFGEKEGIWICTYDEFKALSYVLRDSLLRMSSVKIVQANKGDKMSVLYDYLTSAEFRMSVESIVEGFSAMQDGLNKEKRAMQSIWKAREKQIDKVISSTINMYGSVKGIAGSAVQDIKMLGFDEETFEEEL
ncbi:MAG: DUF2130 domain-containing protein [Bacteroidota bacterium]